MNRTFLALGSAAVVAVIAAVALGMYVNNPRSGVGGPGASPTASPAPTSSAQGSPSATAPASALSGNVPAGPFEFEDNRIAMTVTVPASGWAFDRQFSLLEKGSERDNVPEAAILFWAYPNAPGFDVYGDPCQWASTIPDTPATTVNELAAALAAQPHRDASEPIDVTVGGHAGKSIMLHVPDDAVFDDCDQGNFASYGVAGQSEPSRYHQGPGQIDELWILDVAGSIVVLDAMYRADTSEELIGELRDIAASTTFETP